VEQILLTVAEKKSPITGESFEALSKEYKAKKAAEGLSPIPNLELTGSMLDSLDFRVTSDGIEIGVFGDDAPKADGHNNLSGNSLLPTRRFIPEAGETFSSSIDDEVNRIIADAIGEENEPDVAELEEIDNATDLYDYLIPIFGLGSRTETKLAVLRSDRWTRILTRLGLLKYL
jgi:hypothetical protein